MDAQVQVELLVAFLIYLTIFGWAGRQFGATRLQLLLVVAVVSYFLAVRQTILVRVANLGGKLLAFVQAGGLSENNADAFAALDTAPVFVPDEAVNLFGFLAWTAILVIAAVFIYQQVNPGPQNGAATIWGVIGGILFAWCMLPLMIRVIAPASVEIPAAPPAGEAGPSLRTMLNTIGDAIQATYFGLEGYVNNLLSTVGLALRFETLVRISFMLFLMWIIYVIYRSRVVKESSGNGPAQVIQYAAVLVVIYLIFDIYLGSGGIKLW